MINRYIGSITGNNFTLPRSEQTSLRMRHALRGKNVWWNVKKRVGSRWLSHKICLFSRKSSTWLPPVLKSACNKGSEMKFIFVVFMLSAAVSYQKEFLLCVCSGEAQGQAETQSSLIQYQHVRWTPSVCNIEMSFYSALNQKLAHFYLIKPSHIVLALFMIMHSWDFKPIIIIAAETS